MTATNYKEVGRVSSEDLIWADHNKGWESSGRGGYRRWAGMGCKFMPTIPFPSSRNNNNNKLPSDAVDSARAAGALAFPEPSSSSSSLEAPRRDGEEEPAVLGTPFRAGPAPGGA